MPVWRSLLCLIDTESSIWVSGGFGSLRPIVCQTCPGDEQICRLALRQPRGVNKHRRDTKGKTHSYSIWVKDRLAWTGLQMQLPPPSSWIGESRGVPSSKSFLRVTPVCLCFTVYFLCVVCPALCVKTDSLFPSSPVLTVKQSLHDERALCISSLSATIITKPKIDHAASMHGHPHSHTLHLPHTFTHTHSLSCSAPYMTPTEMFLLPIFFTLMWQLQWEAPFLLRSWQRRYIFFMAVRVH